jgi:WD40 repeat protein
VTFHPDGTVLATSSLDQTVRIWDVARRTTQRVLGPFDSGVNVTAFDPMHPEQLLVGLRDGQLVLMNWSTGAEITRWKEHDGEVLALAYSPRGDCFVSSSADDSVHVMRTGSHERLKVLVHDEARIPAVAFSPDGNWLATGGHDWRVMLWNTSNWESAHALTGHTQGLYGLQFSEDNKRLLSSGSDGVTILWDMSTFREVLRIDGMVAAMRPGSADIATGMPTGETLIWPAFSWKSAAYPGALNQPLNERAESFKRHFWETRLRPATGATPE